MLKNDRLVNIVVPVVETPAIENRTKTKGTTFIRRAALTAVAGLVLTWASAALASGAESGPASTPDVGHPLEEHVDTRESGFARIGWMIAGAVVFQCVHLVFPPMPRPRGSCYVLFQGRPIQGAEAVSNSAPTIIGLDEAHKFIVPRSWRPKHHVKVLGALPAQGRRPIVADGILMKDADTGEWRLDITKIYIPVPARF